MEDTFIDGWNSCREFIVKLLEKETEDWMQNGPPIAAVKAMQKLIGREAVLGLQDGSYRLPSIRVREKSPERSQSRIIPTSGSGPQTMNCPTRMNIGYMTDETRELVNQLTIADELDGTWAEKWKAIQRKEKGKDVGDSNQGSDICS